MSDSRKKLVRFLVAEIEELIDDAEFETRHCDDRLAKREISDYVCKENEGFFHLEADSLRRLLSAIDHLDISLYTSLSEVVTALDLLARKHVSERAEPEAVYMFVSKKLKKVVEYIESGDNS